MFNSSESKGNQWSTSEIHEFMNGTLMNDLFTKDAQDYLTPQTLRTSYYSGGMKTGTDADTSKDDKLFLLSCTRSSSNYGTTDSFILQQTLKVGATASNMDYGSTQTILKAQGTGLAFATGCKYSFNYTWWWLRAGFYNYASLAYRVSPSGNVGGYGVDLALVGVRPACVFNPWYEPQQSSFGVLDNSDEDTTNDVDVAELSGMYYIEYGSYPQTEATSTEVNNINTTTPVGSYKLNKTDGTTYPVYSDGTDKYVLYSSSYYKVEPVRWLILGKVTGDQTSGNQTTEAVTSADFTTVNRTLTYTGDVKNLLVLSEKALVGQVFNSTTANGNRWSTSDICTFMNGTFFSELFATEEQNKIQNTTLKTTWYDGTTVYSGDTADTSIDKLFLLSSEQGSYKTDTFNVQNYFTLKSYGTAHAKASDLGYATGCSKSTASTIKGNTFWWLRAGNYNNVMGVGDVSDGGVFNGNYVNYDDAVRPAFVLKVA